MFQTITANRTGTHRRDQLDGRTYIVAPVRMIVPGVLVGNRGALLYPEQEIRRSVHAWNGVPVVINHPRRNGRHVSARDPEVLSGSGIGFVFNARIEGGSLEAEAWIDIEKVRRIDAPLAERIERGEPIEVSTGLGTENEKQSGTYNGRSYEAIAKNYAPDHLAVLPSERGACSIDDGCGLSVNELSDLVEKYEKSGTDQPFSSWYAEAEEMTIHGSCRCGGTCGRCPNTQPQQGSAMKMTAKQRAEAIERLSDEDLLRIVNAESSEKEDMENEEDDMDGMDEKLRNKVKNMAKKLAKNMYDEKMKENAEAEKKASENAEAEKEEEKTANSWMASAPPEILRLVENARKAEQAERESLIEKLTANNSTVTEDVLQGRSLDDLRLFASFLRDEPAVASTPRPAYNYFGAAAPPPTANAKTTKVEPLGLPKADYMNSKAE